MSSEDWVYLGVYLGTFIITCAVLGYAVYRSYKD